MRIHYFTLLLAIVCTSAVSKAGDVLPYKSDVVVDGSNKEWSSPLPKYDKSTGINYSIANDENSLYFIIRVADEAIQRQIMQYGLEVWINKDGKKKMVTGVTFPLPMSKKMNAEKIVQPEQSQRRPEGETTENMSTEKGQNDKFPRQMGMMNNELILTGYLLENGKQPTRNCPVKVAISRDDSNCMVYELAVPFNTFYKERLDASDANKTFCLGFVIKTAERLNSENSMNMMGDPGRMGGYGGMGGPGGPGGYGGGMGRPDGMGGQSGMSSTNTTPEKSFWLKTQLNIR